MWHPEREKRFNEDLKNIAKSFFDKDENTK